MNWEDHTLYTLKSLYEDDDFREWADAVESGATGDFSDNLKSLISRLAGVLVSEFEIPTLEKDKIVKVLELTAVAGKSL